MGRLFHWWVLIVLRDVSRLQPILDDHSIEVTQSGTSTAQTALREWPRVFHSLLIRFLGHKHLSWRCFSRSACLSIGAFLFITFLWTIVDPTPARRTIFSIDGAMVLLAMMLMINVPTDFVALWETRQMICLARWLHEKRKAGPASTAITVAVADLVVTIILISIGALIGLLLVLPAIYVMGTVGLELSNDADRPMRILRHLWSDGLVAGWGQALTFGPVNDAGDPPATAAMIVLTTFLTTTFIWVILGILGVSMVAIGLLRVPRPHSRRRKRRTGHSREETHEQIALAAAYISAAVVFLALAVI